MKPFQWLQFVSAAALLSGAGLVQAQQTSNPPSWPIQTVSYSAFHQLVSGDKAAPATLSEILAQDLRQLQADEAHRAIIEGFLRTYPNQRLATLYRLEPRDPTVHVALGGDYWSRVTLPDGTSEVIETNGPSVKWGQMSDAIVSSLDAVRQLQLYGSLYSNYQTFYSQFCGSPPGSNLNAVSVAQNNCANIPSPRLAHRSRRLAKCWVGRYTARARYTQLSGLCRLARDSAPSGGRSAALQRAGRRKFRFRRQRQLWGPNPEHWVRALEHRDRRQL